MNIIIPNELTPNGKYTKEAQTEIKERVISYVTKVCEEAERIEMNDGQDIKKIQITPNSIEQAANYVVKYRVEKKKVHWSVAYLCPFINAISGIVVSAAYSMETKDDFRMWCIIGCSVVLVGVLIVQIMYHSFSK